MRSWQKNWTLAKEVTYPGLAFTLKATTPNFATGVACTNSGVFNGTVDWGDGSTSTITAYNDPALAHTYALAGEYIVVISGTFPNISYSGSSWAYHVTSILGNSAPLPVTTLANAFNGCSSLTHMSDLFDPAGIADLGYMLNGCYQLKPLPVFNTASATNMSWTFAVWYLQRGAFPLLDTSNVTDFTYAWYLNYSSGAFPLLDMSSALTVSWAWYQCCVSSIPALNLSACLNFSYAWYTAPNITNVGSLIVTAGTNFSWAWASCANLVSMDLIAFPSATNLTYTWYTCANLTTIPAGMFDACPCTNFTSAFFGCALTVASVNNILISIESNGTSNGILGLNGGTSAAPTGAGLTAKNALIARGWTVTTN